MSPRTQVLVLDVGIKSIDHNSNTHFFIFKKKMKLTVTTPPPGH